MTDLLSTSGLPSTGRAEAWGAMYATKMSLVDFVPGDENQFDAELRMGRLGPVQLARHSVSPCSVERKQSHIANNAPRVHNFLLQAEGTSTFYHCGKEAELVAGDFVLCDTSLPHYFMTDSKSVTVMLRVPSKILRTHLPTPEQFCGQRVGRATGLTGAVAAMVADLSGGGGSPIGAAHEERVANHLLEMIAMSYTIDADASEGVSAIGWQRRKDVVQFIESNLRDPQLSPAMITEGLRVSPRYLRTVFALGGEKMSAYILRRRLEECARQMCNPAWAAHTLTEIAFSWGFNSHAHFTRTFGEKYKMAPREYRKMSLLARA